MKPRIERKIGMRNYRSTKIIAWLLSLIMVINMAPISAFAQGVEGNGVDMPLVIQDLTETTTSVSSNASGSILSLNFAQMESLRFPDDTTESGMEYHLDANVVPVQASGSNGVVRWTYDATNKKLIFKWVDGKVNSFSADIAVKTARAEKTPGEDQYVVRYMMKGEYTYDGQDLRLQDDKISETSFTTFWNKTIYGSDIAGALYLFE